MSSLAHGSLLAFFDALKYDRTMRFAITFATALLLPAIAVAHGVADPPTPFAQARKEFHTKLTTRAPAPQGGAPLGPVAGTERIHYTSGGRTLTAYVSTRLDGGKRPAVLFLHGGFGFGEDDWAMTRPFLDAGYVVMIPVLRGENGQPGDFTTFYGEVDDVLAAADRLAHLPGVDEQRIFVAGHSAGGTLVLLAALASRRFRGGAAFSGITDAATIVKYVPRIVVFDRSDPREIELRSALAFAGTFSCPMRLLYGDDEAIFAADAAKLAERARASKLDVAAIGVPGNHFTAVPREIAEALRFFASLGGIRLK